MLQETRSLLGHKVASTVGTEIISTQEHGTPHTGLACDRPWPVGQQALYRGGISERKAPALAFYTPYANFIIRLPSRWPRSRQGLDEAV